VNDSAGIAHGADVDAHATIPSRRDNIVARILAGAAGTPHSFHEKDVRT
jgi:hypothetical protein